MAKVISVAVERVRDNGDGRRAVMGTFSVECSLGAFNGLFDLKVPMAPEDNRLDLELHACTRERNIHDWLDLNMKPVGSSIVKTVAERSIR